MQLKKHLKNKLQCNTIGFLQSFIVLHWSFFITNNINKSKDTLNKVTCYQVICKIGKDFPDEIHLDFFKALGAICEDFMYGCEEFPNFGIDPKAMPKEVLKLLNSWMPF